MDRKSATDRSISPLLRRMAAVCEACTLCKKARADQKGLAYWFVSKIESGLCPFCWAYGKVHGRKAHEPEPKEN